MILSAAGLDFYFNKTTFGVERLCVSGDPERLSWVRGRTFGLPTGNNFLIKSRFLQYQFEGEFLFFSNLTCTLTVKEKEGAVSFLYHFKNKGKQAVDLAEGDIGIYLPFQDAFDRPDLSLRRRVHAHVRAQGVTHVFCERYSGDMPSLGVVMTQGECYSYSLERSVGKGARGDILLNLPAMRLEVNGEYVCELLVFSCHDRNDFFRKTESYGLLTATADKLCVEEGEEIRFCSSRAISLKTEEQTLLFDQGECTLCPAGVGEHQAVITMGAQSLIVSYYVYPRDLMEKRAHFVLKKQRRSSGPFSGAFTAYDHSTGKYVIRRGVRSPFSLGGYRAAPLLFLLHEMGKGVLSAEMAERVKESVAFYDREIYRGGEVADDVNGKRARFFKKYYHYPLFAAIKYEEYLATKKQECLLQSAVILSNLYKSGSVYEVTPALMVVKALREIGKQKVAEELTELISAAADKLIASGNKYASFKGLPYGPEIVYGALSTLLDAYLLTGKEYYLLTSKEHLARLKTFSFPSLSFATNGVPEIFQRDRKNGLTYDMSPHFTAVHFATVYEKYYQASGEGESREDAERILRACLSLFDQDGASYRSRAAARLVNGFSLPAKEEISCGEDIVLYHFDLLFNVK
ncbi:MAG TPA: hypothetical protein DHV31_01220 [Clostridiales bacterium]|nr:hypothetical protein [Clostridiales bacterium]